MYTGATKTFDENGVGVGLVAYSVETGALGEPMLLHSERCATYEGSRHEADIVAKATTANMLNEHPDGYWIFRSKEDGKGF
jgi:hypothetical protein